MKNSGLFIKAATPIAAVAFTLIGIILLRAQFRGAGALSLLLALIGFIFSMRMLEKSPFTPAEIENLRPYTIPALAWSVILCLLAISVVYVADTVKGPQTDRIAEIAWLTAVILSLVVTWFVYPTSTPPTSLSYTQKLRRDRNSLILLAFIVGLAFTLRTLFLTTHPYPWSGDEASIGIEARRILSGEVTNYFDTGWSSQPNWSFIPTALTTMIVGENILAIRLTSVLAGTLAVLFLFLAARELFNSHIALMAAAILATLPYNVHFSRIGVNNVVDSCMSSLLFWLLARGFRKQDPRLFFSAGIVGGLCIYTYAGTRLVLILGVATLIYFILSQQQYLFTRWPEVAAFGVGAMVSAAPQATFFAQHRAIFLGRFGQEGILLNGWLAQQVAQTGQSFLTILHEQFTRTTLVFIASPALSGFFNSPYPYLTVMGSILFLLGMGYALAYLLEPRHFIPLLWFWSVVFFGGVLTLNPPAHTRLLMTTPVIALFIALGTYKILEYLQRFGLLSKRLIAPMLVLVTVLISYQHISYYMGEYRANQYFQDANGEFAMEAGLMTENLGRDFQVYILGAPRIFAEFPTLEFTLPVNPRADLSPETFPTLEPKPFQKIVFFAIPENRTLLAEIMTKFPGGEGGLVYRKPVPSEILFEYYILRP